jgi:hypothetical protein
MTVRFVTHSITKYIATVTNKKEDKNTTKWILSDPTNGT